MSTQHAGKTLQVLPSALVLTMPLPLPCAAIGGSQLQLRVCRAAVPEN